MSDPEPEFDDACKRVLAGLALGASEGLPMDRRIMLHHAIAQLFPVGTPENQEAARTAALLSEAEKSQLKLTHLLTA